MRANPRELLRGLVRFLTVALLAGLAGAGIGVAIAKLTGSDEPSTATSTTSTAASTATSTTDTARRTTTKEPPKGEQPPRVAILLAQLGQTSQETERARLIVRTRVTNLRDDTLKLKSPVLLSGDDRVPLDDDAKKGAGPLLERLGAGERAVGVLKFTLPATVTARVTADPRARLRIAGRTVDLKVRPPTSAG